ILAVFPSATARQVVEPSLSGRLQSAIADDIVICARIVVPYVSELLQPCANFVELQRPSCGVKDLPQAILERQAVGGLPASAGYFVGRRGRYHADLASVVVAVPHVVLQQQPGTLYLQRVKLGFQLVHALVNLEYLPRDVVLPEANNFVG